MATKHRISKVTTRTGDHGQTKLATGRTIGKHHPIVRAMGSVDELNSHIGVLRSTTTESHQGLLADIQQALFELGAVLAMEGNYAAPDPAGLEEASDQLNAALPPLTEFVLPGGGPAAAQGHVCRSVCRRAETDVWHLLDSLTNAAEEQKATFTQAAQYLNRLSDYFFVLARSLTATGETQWQGPNRG